MSNDGPSDQKDYWSRLIIFMIVSICAFFFLMSWYNFINRRFCLVRAAHNRRVLNQGITPESQPPQPQAQGLSPAIVHALPAFQFMKIKDVEARWIDFDCAVCLGEFEEGEWLRLLPICAHVFHISCVDAWFQTHSNCPLCRSSVVEDLNCNLDCS